MKAADINNGLTVERLKQVLHYDPITGAFTWCAKTSPASRVKIGEAAGSLDTSTGYLRIWIDGERYVAHRLAWLYMTNEWPTEMVDHDDTVKTNNAWVNLRPASNSQNKANGRTYRKRSDLPKGVFKSGNRYGAQIVHQYQHYSLGSFGDPQTAHAAYVSAAKRLHGDFARAA